MGRVRAFSSHVRWGESELRIVETRYYTEPWSDLLCLLPGRSKSQIQNKANALGLVRYRPSKLTADELRKRKREAMAAKRAADPAAARAYERKQHQLNRVARNKTAREYAAKRFFYVKACKLKGTGRATYHDLALLWKKQRGRCALTGRWLSRTAQVDHILPRAKGGGDHIGNLRWLCPEANYAKRDLTDEEFFALCGDVMRWIGERIQEVENLLSA